MRRLCLVLALLLASGPLAAQDAAQDAPQPPGRIVVTGQGRAAAAPDTALLRLGAQAEAEEASAALDAASEEARRLIEALRGAGVAESDIQTSELSLFPRYGEAAPGEDAAVLGYVAANLVTARVRDLDRLGAVLDAAAEAGVSRIDGLSFDLADRGPLMAQARGRAVSDARAAAETLAEAAGLDLGAVLRIEDAPGASLPFAGDMALRAEAASVPVAPGELEATAQVRMVFGIARDEAEGDGEGAVD